LPKQDNVRIAPAEGKLGVLIPGMGAVTTTFIAGLEAFKLGLGKPIGSLTQLGTIRLGKRTEGRTPAIKDFVPLANMDDLVVGCWDIYEDNAYEAAVKAGVLDMALLEKVKEPLSAIRPMKAVFDQKFVKRLDGPNVKTGGTKMQQAEMVMDDIRQFQERTGVSRMTMIWCGSTEVYHSPAKVHATLKDFECGMHHDDPEISPSQIYAYAALKMGVSYSNGAPHLTTDTPALLELARAMNVPVSGKDYKSGQTFMKTLIAPGLKSRMLGLSGWFSTNILGNRDGEVLDDPGSFRSKEVTKSSALEHILQGDLYPDLYKEFNRVLKASADYMHANADEIYPVVGKSYNVEPDIFRGLQATLAEFPAALEQKDLSALKLEWELAHKYRLLTLVPQVENFVWSGVAVQP
jgi:myo-inositol-1-phosphate synthase